MFRNTFLAQVYAHSRGLFIIIVIIILANIGVQITGVQTAPFMSWAMFSKPEAVSQRYRIFELVADGDTLDYTNFATSNLVRNTIIGTLTEYESFVVPTAQEYRIENHLQEHPVRSFLKAKLKGGYGAIQGIAERVTTDKATALQQYPAWLRHYISHHITHQPICHFQVLQTYLKPSGERLYSDILLQ